MCEANVYIEKDGKEELFLEAVSTMLPEGDMWRLENIFGEQRIIRGNIKILALSEDKIVIEEIKD